MLNVLNSFDESIACTSDPDESSKCVTFLDLDLMDFTFS